MIRVWAGAAFVIATSACASAQTAPHFTGLYEISQMEMAGGLELSPDGRFRYAFDYGAVSEESEGRWSVEGDKVLLTTDPMPAPDKCDRGFVTACFNRTPLTSEAENLILFRWDTRIVLRPVQPRPR